MSDMASIPAAELAAPFYQPIIGRDHQVKGYEVLARRWDPAQLSYQGIDFASLSEEQSLHLDIVMLRAVMRDLPTTAKAGSYLLSINLNPTLSSPTYQNLLLLVLIQRASWGSRSGSRCWSMPHCTLRIGR